MSDSFVPDDYVVPLTLTGPGFRPEPLGPQHNDADHRAWMSRWLSAILTWPDVSKHEGQE